jgi:hypothetical protein
MGYGANRCLGRTSVWLLGGNLLSGTANLLAGSIYTGGARDKFL